MCRSRCFVLDETCRVGVTVTSAQFSVKNAKASRMSKERVVIPKDIFTASEPPWAQLGLDML